VEVQEELQEDEEASALVDEAAVEVEASQEVEVVASHQEAEVVLGVDSLADVVDLLPYSGCVDISAFGRMPMATWCCGLRRNSIKGL
jgi:hypothetical protein